MLWFHVFFSCSPDILPLMVTSYGTPNQSLPKSSKCSKKIPPHHCATTIILICWCKEGLICAFMLQQRLRLNLATFSLCCCSILMSQWELQSQFPVVNWQDWHGVVFSAVANLLQGTMCCVFKDAFPQHTCHVAHSEQPTESSLEGPERQNCSGHWGSLYGQVHIGFAQRNSM